MCSRMYVFFLLAIVATVESLSVYDLLTDFRRDGVVGKSERCQAQQQAYFDGLLREEGWAWNMLDATGKIAPAILRGNSDDMGFYDECVNINEEVDGDTIKGRYCYFGLLVPWQYIVPDGGFNFSELSSSSIDKQMYSPPKILDQPRIYNKREISARNQLEPDPITVYGIALCIPDACLPSDFVGDLISNDAYCETKNENSGLDAGDIACIAFFGVIIGLMVISTCYDVYIQRQNQKALHPICLAFSVYTNGKKILQVSKPGESGQILCFQGLKAISLFWVIAGHTISGKQSFGSLNLFDTYDWMHRWYAVYILQAPLAVDTFLFLSGVLLSYNFIKTMSKPKARFNILLYYIHRYIRLTPAFAALYFFSVTVLRRIMDGPGWTPGMQEIRRACLDHWWAVFLYVQNYVYVDDMCLVPVWYLSVDMQLFIVSPLILLPLLKFRKYMLRFGLPLAIFGSILCPFLVIYLNDVGLWTEDYYNMYYYVTHTRFGPWLVGIAFGVYLLKVQDKKFKINPYVNICCWLIDFGLMAAIFFTQKDLAYNHDKLKNAFYLSLIRPAWGVCLCWVVFACVKGYGGIINTFLCIPIFQVVAKLSYSVYVVHYTFVYAVQAHRRVKTYYHDFENLQEIAANIVFALIIGAFWTLAFESPMITLEKIIFGGGARPPRKREEAVGNNDRNTENNTNNDNDKDTSSKDVSAPFEVKVEDGCNENEEKSKL